MESMIEIYADCWSYIGDNIPHLENPFQLDVIINIEQKSGLGFGALTLFFRNRHALDVP